jgi:multidrug resistance efflux pump
LTATVLAGVALAGCAAGAGWYFFLRDPGALVLPGLVETQEVRLCSKVGGRVLRTEVREGDLVRPGQALVVFEAPELHAQLLQQQARLAAAQADLDRTRNGPRAEEKENARAALAAARARHAKLRAGNRAEEIEQARADLASAEAEWLGACRDKRRAAQMIATRAVSQQEYDAALAAHDRLSAKRAAARARLKLLEAGARAEDVAEAAADVDQKRASYELLRQGSRSEDVAAAEAKVAELQARVEELKATLAEAVVTAPQRAVVEVLAVRKGDVVGPNQPVARVLCADELWVKVYVPETELGKLRLRQAVAVSIDAYPGRTFRGEVYQINAVSEFTPRNVQSADERRHQVFGVKVRVADPQGAFKSGMAASVRVNLARPEGGLGETKP